MHPGPEGKVRLLLLLAAGAISLRFMCRTYFRQGTQGRGRPGTPRK